MLCQDRTRSGPSAGSFWSRINVRARGYNPLTLPLTSRRAHLLLLMFAVLLAYSCSKFGYSNRVVHRIPSPNGQLVAVCQEVPIFDGPEFDVRLEHQDGTLIRKLFHMGDGGGCGEVVWSQNGRTLAVLTSHVATITVVDVEWALSHPAVLERHWFTRQFSFSESIVRQGTELRFVGPSEVEFKLCDYSIQETQSNHGRIRSPSIGQVGSLAMNRSQENRKISERSNRIRGHCLARRIVHAAVLGAR